MNKKGEVIVFAMDIKGKKKKKRKRKRDDNSSHISSNEGIRKERLILPEIVPMTILL